MNDRSTYRDLVLLMIGVASIVVFGAVAFLHGADSQSNRLEDIPTRKAMQALLQTELEHLFQEGIASTESTLSIGPGLTQNAMEAVKDIDLLWTQEAEWPNNQGIPTPGILLIRQLQIDGEIGILSVVVGEVAGPLACGITVEVRYVWRGRWTERAGRQTMC